MSANNKISRRDALKRMGTAIASAAIASSGLFSLTSCEGKGRNASSCISRVRENCLYVARQLAGENGELLSVPQMVKRGKYDLEADEIG